jgi:hypothetical protein
MNTCPCGNHFEGGNLLENDENRMSCVMFCHYRSDIYLFYLDLPSSFFNSFFCTPGKRLCLPHDLCRDGHVLPAAAATAAAAGSVCPSGQDSASERNYVVSDVIDITQSAETVVDNRLVCMEFSSISSSANIYIYVCVCVCVCVYRKICDVT